MATNSSHSLLSIVDLLSLRELASCKVVAGANGLWRTVRWVHTSDLPDAPFWLRGGELLIHSGAYKGLNLVHLIRQLNSAGASGVAIAEASDLMTNEACRIADELNFPLILIPDEVRFVDLTYAIAHALLDKELGLSLDIENFWRNATQTAVYDLGNTLQYVANWLDCSVTLFDRFYTQILSKSPSHKVQSLKTIPVSEAELNEAIRSSDGICFSNQGIQRWIASVRNNSSIFGFVVIQSSHEKIDRLPFRVVLPAVQLIRIAATIASQTQDLRLQLSEDIFRSILEEEDLDQKEVHMRCKEVGLNLNRPGRIVLFKSLDGDVNLTFRNIEPVIVNLSREGTIVRPNHDTIIVWTPVMNKQDRDGHGLFMKRIRRELEKSVGSADWFISVGGEHAGIEGIRKSQKQAQIALRRHSQSAITYFEDLSAWDILMDQLDQGISQETVENYVSPLSLKERARLTETVNALIQADFNISKAAEKLTLHRNGLNRRLHRWREKLKIDLGRPQNVLAFSAILAATNSRPDSANSSGRPK